MFKTNKVTTAAFTSIALALIIFVGPMSTMMSNAQATTLSATQPPNSNTNTATSTSSQQAQQNQMINTQAMTTQQVTNEERTAGNTVFTTRWGDVSFIGPNTIGALFAFCNTGEFAVSGLKIYGGNLLTMEDYGVGLPGNSMMWLTIVKNIDSKTLPASIGVNCADGTDTAGTSTSGVSDVTKNILNQKINIAINNGDINVFQVVQVINQVVNIINSTITNSTLNINQTANQAFNQVLNNVTGGPEVNVTGGPEVNVTGGPTGGAETGGGTNDTSNERTPCPIGWRFVNGECINPNAPAEGAIGPNDNTGGGTTEGSTGETGGGEATETTGSTGGEAVGEENNDQSGGEGGGGGETTDTSGETGGSESEENSDDGQPADNRAAG